MGSPVTFSGFTSIDWNSVLNAVMAQESQPVTVLQSQRSTLGSQQNAFSTLATKLSALETATSELSSSATGVGGRTGSSTDSDAVRIAAGSTASVGVYDVVVSRLARAQTTASTSLHPDCRHERRVASRRVRSIINGETVWYGRGCRQRCRSWRTPSTRPAEDIGVSRHRGRARPLAGTRLVLDEPLHPERPTASRFRTI